MSDSQMVFDQSIQIHIIWQKPFDQHNVGDLHIHDLIMQLKVVCINKLTVYNCDDQMSVGQSLFTQKAWFNVFCSKTILPTQCLTDTAMTPLFG